MKKTVSTFIHIYSSGDILFSSVGKNMVTDMAKVLELPGFCLFVCLFCLKGSEALKNNVSTVVQFFGHGCTWIVGIERFKLIFIYLTHVNEITRPLRSSTDTSILCIPTVRTHSLGQRSFSYASPAVWNTLPYDIRSSNTLSSFKSSLKAYLFQQSYWLCVWEEGGKE